MKIFKLTIILLFISYSFCQGKEVNIKKEGGGPNGYATVSEHHDTGLFHENVHNLTCLDEGNDACVWADRPYIEVDNDVDFIESQIASGNLSGSVVIGSRTISWNATDVDNYSATIILPYIEL